MNPLTTLTHPWLIAVWPGIGHVAMNAGYYLMSKLGMSVLSELHTSSLFDIDHVEVQKGILHTGRRPRSRFFLYSDPEKKRDLVLFLGEGQPPLGKYQYCQSVVEYAQKLKVERIYTFAAMATQMHPEHPSKVFVAATNEQNLEELQTQDVHVLEDGHIGGLNGVLLGVAAEKGLHGACLLGEMPHIFAQLPFPKASQAILEVFTAFTGIEIDFTEMTEEARRMEEQMGDILSQMEEKLGQAFTPPDDEEKLHMPMTAIEKLSDEDRQKLDQLFVQAKSDRKKAFELKQELDRLSVFKDYEDRFLDLFKKS
ncbi:MAG TPA: PAC2 family protein [Gemmatales bacterium]|nr:PAC2 family protein [Gemmatales bacterium]